MTTIQPKKLALTSMLAMALVLASMLPASAANPLRFYGPTTPPGGFYPECAYASASPLTYPTAGVSSQTYSRYSSGGTCNNVLTRPSDFLRSNSIVWYAGSVCASSGWNSNAANTSSVTSYAYCYSGSPSALWAQGQYKAGSSYYSGTATIP